METNGWEEAEGRRVGLGKRGAAREGERQGRRNMDAQSPQSPHAISHLLHAGHQASLSHFWGWLVALCRSSISPWSGWILPSQLPSTAVATFLSSGGFAKHGPNCCLVDGNLSNVPAAADLRRAMREPSLGYLYRCALGCSRPSLVRPCWRLLNATPNAAELPSSANDAGHSLRVCPGYFAAPGRVFPSILCGFASPSLSLGFYGQVQSRRAARGSPN